MSFGHSLNEVFSGDPERVAKRADLLARWSSALSPNGVILVIEPAPFFRQVAIFLPCATFSLSGVGR